MNGITNILVIAKVSQLMLETQITENLLLASHNILMDHFERPDSSSPINCLQNLKSSVRCGYNCDP
ncbi:hypothetical protein SADUNF_Sadunf16G0168400 [Salix dunnii]|uniref:Uncharacterized protein n=1 Tax=Salix dunnii TaxID=1413687 RepID=A0A835MGQ8_9ROSI|nr:hypothetical protein SADUNF_Sadunf16G0168400 [Salix dunnii]